MSEYDEAFLQTHFVFSQVIAAFIRALRHSA